jgi:hypothetical protein
MVTLTLSVLGSFTPEVLLASYSWTDSDGYRHTVTCQQMCDAFDKRLDIFRPNIQLHVLCETQRVGQAQRSILEQEWKDLMRLLTGIRDEMESLAGENSGTMSFLKILVYFSGCLCAISTAEKVGLPLHKPYRRFMPHKGGDDACPFESPPVKSLAQVSTVL